MREGRTVGNWIKHKHYPLCFQVVDLLVSMCRSALESPRKVVIFEPYPSVVDPNDPQMLAFNPRVSSCLQANAAFPIIVIEILDSLLALFFLPQCLSLSVSMFILSPLSAFLSFKFELHWLREKERIFLLVCCVHFTPCFSFPVSSPDTWRLVKVELMFLIDWHFFRKSL